MDIQIENAKSEDAEDWARITKECWLDVYPNKDSNWLINQNYGE